MYAFQLCRRSEKRIAGVVCTLPVQYERPCASLAPSVASKVRASSKQASGKFVLQRTRTPEPLLLSIFPFQLACGIVHGDGVSAGTVAHSAKSKTLPSGLPALSVSADTISLRSVRKISTGGRGLLASWKRTHTCAGVARHRVCNVRNAACMCL
jgi:hypothetical protein